MPAEPDAVALAVAACRAADDRLATDLELLEVADLLAVVDVFVLATAGNDRQLKAIAEEVEHVLRVEHERTPLRREGTTESGWVLLDYGDVVCHLLTADRRDFYALERLWADVPRRDPMTGDQRDSAVVAGARAASGVDRGAGDPRDEPAHRPFRHRDGA